MDLSECHAIFDLHLVAGTDFGEVLEVREDGIPVDLTGVVGRLEIAPYPAEQPAFSYEGAPFVLTATPEDYQLTIAVPEGETRNMNRRASSRRFLERDPDEWRWRVILTYPNGTREALAGGRLLVHGELVGTI